MIKNTNFADRFRRGEQLVGYWSMLDSVVGVERIARVGYDYVCVDVQHGYGGYSGMINSLIAIDTSANTVSLVRVAANSPSEIGKALDAGATGIIVPLINTAADAKKVVAAAKYPPRGVRSYGPIRSATGAQPNTLDRDQATLCIAMIETSQGLENVSEICAVSGLDGIYIGPSDLSLVMGARYPGDPEISEKFESTLARIRFIAHSAGKSIGIHCATGTIAAQRLTEGFNFASVASDINHLEQIATEHLRTVRQ